MSNPKRRQIIQFTPEQEKQFNQVTVPGTNVNSNATDARKIGVQAQNFQTKEAARKDAEIEARSDRKTVKRQTTVGERLRGDNGYSSYMSAGTPLSGRDPALGTIFDWTVGPKGVEALGKTLLWNYAKHIPTSELGRWGRNYFTNQALKEGIKDFGRNLSNRLYIENAGKYTLFNQFGDDIGTLLTTKPLNSEAKGKGIGMVASKNGGHKVSEDLYNIAVQDSKELGYQGLESGHALFSPNLTMHVTDKFPKVEWPNVSLQQDFDGKYQFPPIRLLTGTTERPQPNFIQELTNHRIDLGDLRKPNVSVTANVETTAKQGANALSQEEIQKAFEAARQWHLNRINSPGYTKRALRAGFTEEEVPQLQQQLIEQINRLKLQSPKDVLGPMRIRETHNSNGKALSGYWRTKINGNLKQGIAFYNPYMSYDEAVSNFIHEFGHGATFSLNGTETSGYMKALADQFPLINRLVKYNRSLYPEINAGRVEYAVPGATRSGNAVYYASPTEMQSRGYEFMRDYANNWFKAYKSGELPSKLHQDLVGTRRNSNIFNIIATPKGAANFQKNALGISVPLGLGGYSLYSNNNQQQQLQYQKQGGKMNTLQFLKNDKLNTIDFLL